MTNRSLRIVQVLLSSRIGGAETVAATLGAELTALGHNVKIVYLDSEADGRAGRLTKQLRRFRNLSRALTDLQPDAVIAHSALPNIYARIPWQKAPVVVVLHSASDDYREAQLRWMERLLRNFTAHVIAVSDGQAEAYLRRFGSSVPVSVIPNAINADLFELEKELPSEPVNVVTVARVTEQKNPKLWVATALRCIETHPNLKFWWFGPIDDSISIRAIVDSYYQNEKLIFAGPSADVGKVLCGADVYFHPSDREAHSLALLEAAAVGVPVVCADRAVSGKSARIPIATFSSGSHEEAAIALDRVVQNYVQAGQHAYPLKEWVRNEGNAAIMAKRYIEVIEQARS